jgi:hypothetical protein
MKENELRNERHFDAWKRACNRGKRSRRCLFCRNWFDAGDPTRGRPRETCSKTCADGREVERRRLIRNGVITPAQRVPKPPKLSAWGWGDHVRYANGYDGHRVSDELRDFLDAFPYGGWTITDQP